MAKKMTRKQARLVKAVALDPLATLDELGQRADYHDKANVARALKAPAVVDAMDKIRGLMEKREKLSLGALLVKIEEGLEATDLKSVEIHGSKLKARLEVPDQSTRHKFLETALELHGVREKEGAAAANGPVNLAIIFSGGGTELERQGLTDVLVAARLTRGLHPIENRKLTPEEAQSMRGAT